MKITHKETIMKTLSNIFSRIFSSNDSVHATWDRERRNAARFGPSHVAEIDAIFSRHI